MFWKLDSALRVESPIMFWKLDSALRVESPIMFEFLDSSTSGITFKLIF
jgi:hypothetical protein